MQSAVIKHENNLKNIYSESRVANFDDYVKKKDRFRHTLLHWHQIPRANNPEKPLQNNALNILSVVVFKLKMQKIVVLNQNYLSRVTQCKSDQNANLVKQLTSILDIKFHRKIIIEGKINRNVYVFQHTKNGQDVLNNSSVLLSQIHFVGKLATNPANSIVKEGNQEPSLPEKIQATNLYKEETFKKDRSSTQMRESNFVSFNQIKDKIKPAELEETKKMVSGGYSANTELQADTVGQVASVTKLKSRNKNLTNRRKTRTNAELNKYKAAKVIGSSAFLMGKFIQSSRNPLNPSKVFEKATHY